MFKITKQENLSSLDFFFLVFSKHNKMLPGKINNRHYFFSTVFPLSLFILIVTLYELSEAI